MNSEGEIDEQGKEFKAIVAEGTKLAASLAMSEHIPWLRWMFPIKEEAFKKHGARRDILTRTIMEERTHKNAIRVVTPNTILWTHCLHCKTSMI